MPTFIPVIEPRQIKIWRVVFKYFQEYENCSQSQRLQHPMSPNLNTSKTYHNTHSHQVTSVPYQQALSLWTATHTHTHRQTDTWTPLQTIH